MIINASDWSRPKLDQDHIIQNQVAKILTDIELNGDAAIAKYALQFDRQAPQIINLKPFAEYELVPELAAAIQLAAQRIENFARFQMMGIESRSFSDEFGSYSQNVIPLERVGAYIPGGRYPLISTALMTLIPAKVAGCPIRIACSPSNDPAILAAASLAGATQFIQLGGAQAIAGLAYGLFTDSTQPINPVDLIVGPGNAYVNEAKKQLQAKVKIDGLAGPSELMALCDGQQNIEWIVLDALAQAEHDPNACSLIVSDDLAWLEKVAAYLSSQTETQDLVKQRQVELILANNPAQMIAFSERYAPEHLMLCHSLIKTTDLTHYGSLFVGIYSAVALGDYISGPNHTLPTLGNAKQSGGLSVFNFLKINTSQTLTNRKNKQLFESAICLAKAEGLTHHFLSLSARIQ